jgi:hypothetical protein
VEEQRLVVDDTADRDARTLADGEELGIGRCRVQWLDTPHLPHAWESGLLMEHTTRTLLCSDLFTEGGTDHPALFEGDILGPSDAFRRKLDFYNHTKDTRAMLTRLAALKPTTLARMHGSAWRGDGAGLLLALAEALEAGPWTCDKDGPSGGQPRLAAVGKSVLTLTESTTKPSAKFP